MTTDRSKLMEEVAMALALSKYGHPGYEDVKENWERLLPSAKNECRNDARIAIAVTHKHLLEPTDKMIDAGWDSIRDNADYDDRGVMPGVEEFAWEAMLKAGPTGSETDGTD